MPCVVNSCFCNPRTTQKRGESFGISRIGNKIKGVFKSSAMEGAMLPNYNLNEGEDDFVSESFRFLFKSLVLLHLLPCFASLFGSVSAFSAAFFLFHCRVSMYWLLIQLPCFPCIHSQTSFCASKLIALVQESTQSSGVRHFCKRGIFL